MNCIYNKKMKSFQVTEATRRQDLQEICRFLELFRRFLEHQTIYDWHTASFQGRNNYCRFDNLRHPLLFIRFISGYRIPLVRFFEALLLLSDFLLLFYFFYSRYGNLSMLPLHLCREPKRQVHQNRISLFH